jgi:hypothetical protein
MPSTMRLLFGLIAPLLAASAHAQGPSATQTLLYAPPANVFRAGIDPAEDYSFNGFNASVQVYQFRRFTGNIQQVFQTTLLRHWIAPVHQEENVAGQPTFQTLQVPGAQLALMASFTENIAGLPKPHARMLIVANEEAAIVDASAGTLQSWQQAIPALNTMAGTLRVQVSRAHPPVTQAAGRSIAGLYRGMKQKYMATMYNVTGSGYYTNALHYYLFSADGRVYRAYDALDVPAGNIGLFDFAAAQRGDPENSGHYTTDGGKLIIRMESSPQETIVTELPRGGTLSISSIVYERQ